ncbi:hypothetical protein ACFSBS_17705 [Azospirillum griseum]
MVNLTNLAGKGISINSFSINGTEITGNLKHLRFGQTFMASYNDKPGSQFTSLKLVLVMSGVTYHIDLNKDHYFGGGEYHYPGDDSDVSYTLFGTNDSGSQMQFRLVYGKGGSDRLIYTNDTKYLDRV